MVRMVAQEEAVESVARKLRIRARDNAAWHRLVTATDRALLRYRQVQGADHRGFYHGLITGYAVAIQALRGKVTPTPRV